MELRTNVNGYDVITKDNFQTWVRDSEGKAINFYRCKESMSLKQFHETCVKRFKKEMEG